MNQEDLIAKLQTVDISSVSYFSFDGTDTLGLIANIHDPDTFTVVFEWKDILVKDNIRLNGLDAPELHSEVEAERNVCLAGIDVLNKMIGGQVVRLLLGKRDKYGRSLCTVFTLDGLCINDYLIDYHYVRGYDGGHKGPWTPEELAMAGSKQIGDTPSDVCNKKKRRSRHITTPVVDTPDVDTPVVDTPDIDTSTIDTSTVDTPVVDTPDIDISTVDTPVVDTPVVDTSTVDTPDTPIVDMPDVPIVKKKKRFTRKVTV